MKKILLPTDFSDNAWNAIVYSLDFLKDEKCQFHILHTYTPTFYRADYMMGGPTYSALPDIGVEVAQAGLDKTLVDIEVKFKNPNHRFKTQSAFNTLANEIMELSERDFDLIVMGTQGATGAKEIFLGTHTVQVLRKSRIPVLVIPQAYAFKEIKSILFPSDYAMPFTKDELQILIYITQMHKARLKVVNVNDDNGLTESQKANKKSLETIFKVLQPTFEQVHGQLMPNAIHEYIEQNDTSLLAMMNRKHSFFDRLLVKPNIDSIGYHTKIPFLALPQTSAKTT